MVGHPAAIHFDSVVAVHLKWALSLGRLEPGERRLRNLCHHGGKLEVRWHAADALNTIAKAEYSLDGGEWTVVAPVTKLSDSLDLDYDLTIDAGPGEHTIAVRVADDYENLASDKVVVRP